MGKFSPREIKPRISYDHSGNLYLEITIGRKTLRRNLPPFQTRDEARVYIDKLVPQMIEAHYKSRRLYIVPRRENDIRMEKKEQQVDEQGKDCPADGGAAPSTDGDGGV